MGRESINPVARSGMSVVDRPSHPRIEAKRLSPCVECLKSCIGARQRWYEQLQRLQRLGLTSNCTSYLELRYLRLCFSRGLLLRICLESVPQPLNSEVQHSLLSSSLLLLLYPRLPSSLSLIPHPISLFPFPSPFPCRSARRYASPTLFILVDPTPSWPVASLKAVLESTFFLQRQQPPCRCHRHGRRLGHSPLGFIAFWGPIPLTLLACSLACCLLSLFPLAFALALASACSVVSSFLSGIQCGLLIFNHLILALPGLPGSRITVGSFSVDRSV